VALAKAEIKLVEHARKTARKHNPEIINWPYRNNPILRLTNGHVLEGRIIEARDEYIVMREEIKTDSYIEYQIQRNRIDAIEFNASNTRESRLIQRCLMNQYPKLSTYESLIKHARAFYTRTSADDVDDFRPSIIGRIWNAISHH